MFRRPLLAAALLCLAAFAGHAAAQTIDVSGVKFSHSVALAGSALQLNGAGTRYKTIIKVYAAALYLPAKANTAEAVLASAGPKRMQVVMLRDIDANELGKLFTKGMEQNASREEFSKVIPGVIKMSDIFSQRKKLLPGEYFTIDYVPGTGSVISVMGKPASDPIKEPEFFNALMKIWLGKSPADAQLKDLLLGKSPATKDAFN